MDTFSPVISLDEANYPMVFTKIVSYDESCGVLDETGWSGMTINNYSPTTHTYLTVDEFVIQEGVTHIIDWDLVIQ